MWNDMTSIILKFEQAVNKEWSPWYWSEDSPPNQRFIVQYLFRRLFDSRDLQMAVFG